MRHKVVPPNVPHFLLSPLLKTKKLQKTRSAANSQERNYFPTLALSTSGYGSRSNLLSAIQLPFLTPSIIRPYRKVNQYSERKYIFFAAKKYYRILLYQRRFFRLTNASSTFTIFIVKEVHKKIHHIFIYPNLF